MCLEEVVLGLRSVLSGIGCKGREGCAERRVVSQSAQE